MESITNRKTRKTSESQRHLRDAVPESKLLRIYYIALSPMKSITKQKLDNPARQKAAGDNRQGSCKFNGMKTLKRKSNDKKNLQKT